MMAPVSVDDGTSVPEQAINTSESNRRRHSVPGWLLRHDYLQRCHMHGQAHDSQPARLAGPLNHPGYIASSPIAEVVPFIPPVEGHRLPFYERRQGHNGSDKGHNQNHKLNERFYAQNGSPNTTTLASISESTQQNLR